MINQEQDAGCNHQRQREGSAKARARRAAKKAAQASLYAPYLLGVDHILGRAAQEDTPNLEKTQSTSAVAIAGMVRDLLQGSMSATTSEGVLELALTARELGYLDDDAVQDLLDIFVSAKSAMTKGVDEVGEWAHDYVLHNYCEREGGQAVEEAERFAARMAKLAEDVATYRAA
jgi:hypothetical protein